MSEQRPGTRRSSPVAGVAPSRPPVALPCTGPQSPPLCSCCSARNEWMSGWKEEWMNEWMSGLKKEWMKRWEKGWMNRWIEKKMDE